MKLSVDKKWIIVTCIGVLLALGSVIAWHFINRDLKASITRRSIVSIEVGMSLCEADSILGGYDSRSIHSISIDSDTIFSINYYAGFAAPDFYRLLVRRDTVVGIVIPEELSQ